MRQAPSATAIVTALRQAKPALVARYPVRTMALFGSVARGDATEESDVDILVDVDPSIGLGMVALGDEIEKLLGRRVDLVSKRAVRPRMLKAIESEKLDV